MRPQAVALTEPTTRRPSSSRRCALPAFAIEALTHALARLRRGASALEAENAELRVKLDRIRQMAEHGDAS
jgi:hypothetical protein